MMVPMVTIGVTCFNAERTIIRALDSAAKQNWPNTEILIVDDGSSDGSVNLIEDWISSTQNARLVRHVQNIGTGGARNTIIEDAKGEFIAFFDDDDEAAVNRLRCQVECLEKYERRTGADLVACYASGVRVYPSGYRLPLPAIGSRDGAVPHGPELAQYLLYYHRRVGWFYGSGTPTCSLLARRSTFLAVGGFDERLSRLEDADFAIRLSLLGGHFVGTLKELFVQYATSGSDKSADRILEAALMLAEKHQKFLEMKGFYQYAVRWPKIRYLHFKRQYLRFIVETFSLFRYYPLSVTRHLLSTGPKRVLHEMRIGRG